MIVSWHNTVLCITIATYNIVLLWHHVALRQMLRYTHPNVCTILFTESSFVNQKMYFEFQECMLNRMCNARCFSGNVTWIETHTNGEWTGGFNLSDDSCDKLYGQLNAGPRLVSSEGSNQLNRLTPAQNGRRFAYRIFKCIFLSENVLHLDSHFTKDCSWGLNW